MCGPWKEFHANVLEHPQHLQKGEAHWGPVGRSSQRLAKNAEAILIAIAALRYPSAMAILRC